MCASSSVCWVFPFMALLEGSCLRSIHLLVDLGFHGALRGGWSCLLFNSREQELQTPNRVLLEFMCILLKCVSVLRPTIYSKKFCFKMSTAKVGFDIRYIQLPRYLFEHKTKQNASSALHIRHCCLAIQWQCCIMKPWKSLPA